jgi:hypothetical protein
MRKMMEGGTAHQPVTYSGYLLKFKRKYMQFERGQVFIMETMKHIGF